MHLRRLLGVHWLALSSVVVAVPNHDMPDAKIRCIFLLRDGKSEGGAIIKSPHSTYAEK
jgi:hypothetical protein